VLRLSKKADYAIILLCHLLQNNSPVSAQELAQYYHLPQPMIANILKSLAGQGIVESRRGQHGGYTLSRPASMISLGDVVRLVDGPFNLMECVHDKDICKVASFCPTRMPLITLHNKIEQFMDSLTLDQIINHPLYTPIIKRGLNETTHLS
jgi:Rrf2 family transcriptional regulator, cysteine metabolism repressor